MYALGSSYLFRQSPGAERIGGVHVRLSRASGDQSGFKIEKTLFRSGDEPGDVPADLIESAIRGARKFASDHALDLEEWSVELSEFAAHPTDSSPLTMQIAAYSAMASAFATFTSKALTVQKTHPSPALLTRDRREKP